MRKDTRNWLETAEYDLESARHMLSSSRYLHVVFFCHVALEKALKAVVSEVTGKYAPRTHNLLDLVNLARLTPTPEQREFLTELNDASIPTRYPEDLREAVRVFTRARVFRILQQAQETIAWIRSHPSLAES